MTFTPTRYKTYLEYLNTDLSSEGNFRLLSNGEVIELPPEDRENYFIADELVELFKRLLPNRRLASSDTELQVHPVGDNCVNRRPDLTVLRPEHLNLMDQIKKNVILLDMPSPLLVAEVVSPGSTNTDNYRRDYEWKRQQYEWWKIPEYWIIDRHRQQVLIFTLEGDRYKEQCYQNADPILSSVFPKIKLTAEKLLSGDIL